MTHDNMTPKEFVYKRIDNYKDMVESDPYQLHYHLMPPIGLLNDPNGFVYFKGYYHIFYQWNPFETKHGTKFWGHYISDDLVHWKHAPIALAPEDWYDKNGCYSGSAIVYQGTLYLFYTGNVRDDDGNRESYQCMAVSSDGLHFDKKGPIIHVPEGYTAHFRDPKVFCKGERWYMVVGAQTKDEKGEVVLFTSTDLESWDFKGPLAGSDLNGLGDFGYMWECPDLFELDHQGILIVSPQGLGAKGYEFNNIYQSGYFAGKLDYHNLTFEHGDFTELDRGFDFYAPQTTVDTNGRRILFGWMGNAEEEASTHPTTQHKWMHNLTIPRQLDWRNGKLVQHPVTELRDLRENEVKYENVTVSNQREAKFSGVEGNVFELCVSITDWNATGFTIGIGKNNRMEYDQTTNTFTLERLSFAEKNKVESRHCVLQKLESIQVFKDTSSIEIFINNGGVVFSARVFDDPEDIGVIFRVIGSVTMNVRKWDMKKVLL
ncbi:glycoside hydrolase family 32 protein [Lentibacillus salicampi]|uniref:Sucrose-6-phosphate hydrolase n=1 Tax=Lentibacillus salicampi TaxID=175306 RepID=A0A4Y9AAL9_9BACI|nr:sucrose-6-phosphate hydrolase [Lentibacillus salicampi]TFJ91404.1 sucrose-6-phosphate hydrolase [Lentibacillus salicampi]